jgi:hypothetical protein
MKSKTNKRLIIFIQYPICDIRPLLSSDQNHLKPRPTWDNPKPSKHFVQYFGHLKRRKKGGHDYFHDELYFINGKGGFKLPKLEKVAIKELSNLQCIFRRLLNDGKSSIRYEIGLTSDHLVIADSDRQNPFRAFKKLVTHICHIPVKIKNLERDPFETRVIDCSKKLGELYEKASAADYPYSSNGIKFVSTGEMCMLLEYNNTDFQIQDAQEVAKGLKLAFKWIEVDGKDVGVFFLEKRSDFELTALRKIRIGIMRTFAEHQNLINVLSYLDYKNLTFDPAKLNEYLNEKTSFFNKKNEVIKNLILSYYNLITPEEIFNIEEKLDNLKLQVKKKVWDHLRDASTKYISESGDFSDIKHAVGQLIKNNKTKEALDVLKTTIESIDDPVAANSIIVLESRYREIEISIIDGTIGYNDLSIAQNKLRVSILKLASLVAAHPKPA